MNKIKLFDPCISEQEEKQLIRALRSGHWASGGGSNLVNLFEKKFAKYIGAKTCVAVNNGTSALHLALSEADVTGNEVILPSLTFVSTAHSVLYNNGKIKFADIDPTTLCMDIDSAKKLVTKRTRVILPVHFGGMPADLRSLGNLAAETDSLLIDDAAHAAGATFQGKKIGSIGAMSCFSFPPCQESGNAYWRTCSLESKKLQTSTKKTTLTPLVWYNRQKRSRL